MENYSNYIYKWSDFTNKSEKVQTFRHHENYTDCRTESNSDTIQIDDKLGTKD